MPVPMPAAIVLIVCKTVALPYADPVQEANAAYTNHENRRWATENSMMTCRRHEVQVYDQAEAQGADPQPFNNMRCIMSALRLGPEWNESHKSSSYRFWRVACPVPVVNTITGEIIAWKMPECGRRDTVICERDTTI